MAALRLNWGGLGRWISDQIRQQQIDEGLQFAASQRGVLSNLRY
jgi:ABC-type antimicrobial peptide transport system permease subunit